MLHVYAHINLIACRNDESAVGAGCGGGFNNAAEGCILVFSLRLRISYIEECESIVFAACGFNYACFAPPAFFGTLDNIYAALLTDTGNQVGTFRSRNKKVYDWLNQYIG